MTSSRVNEIIILCPSGKDLRQQVHIRLIWMIRGQQQTLNLISQTQGGNPYQFEVYKKNCISIICFELSLLFGILKYIVAIISVSDDFHQKC